MVSIARVVSFGARVVIMDEPTSALAGSEVDILYGVLEQLRRDGRGIIYVSHRLSECYRLCDRLTVLRDGRMVESAATAHLPRARLVAAMLGRESMAGNQAAAKRPTSGTEAATAPTEIALSVKGLTWRTRVRNVSLAVRRGEILGLVGLLGAGRTETFKAIYGAETPDHGTVDVAGRPLNPARPANSLRRGLAFLSEDRRSEGIFPELSVPRQSDGGRAAPHFALWCRLPPKTDDLVTRYIREFGHQDRRAGRANFGTVWRQSAEGTDRTGAVHRTAGRYAR